MAVNTPNINTILAMPAHRASSKYGAQMGRGNKIGEPAKLYLQRVSFQDDCYDRGGAYWGMPADLWCAFAGDENDEIATMIFVRAKDRKDAKRAVIETIDDRTGDTELWSFQR